MITREIYIGNLALGGTNPVRIQSMTNTNTAHTQATVHQVLQLVAAGCQMVRLTARNKAEAENLAQIKAQLQHHNCHVPLIADIHFQPEAAEIAARIVNKVRINPGNYAGKTPASHNTKNYTQTEYQHELDKINTRITPLINICKQYGTAIRIGVNHGSLSPRITQRHGDTPQGMVISAIEFISMFVAQGFHNLVLSMKSSNVKTMIYAYRLLAAQTAQLGYNYPLHLGVTEAGAGADARIKSAAGIGQLLMEGLGDTIRVSLTENPIHEIQVAQQLCAQLAPYRNHPQATFHHEYSYTKPQTIDIGPILSSHPPLTLTTHKNTKTETHYTPDIYYDIHHHNLIKFNTQQTAPIHYIDASQFQPPKQPFAPNHIMLYDITHCSSLPEARNALFQLKQNHHTQPIILYKKYHNHPPNKLTLLASAEFAYFLTDGLLNGICIDANNHTKQQLPALMFSVLQAMGLRRFKAEFIACPTCGRTAFNVEETLKKLTQSLSHLKQLKIGVMGCIVNGPGEMADADYGYVGSSAGKINLYKGKTLMAKNIAESNALHELIQIIKANNDWQEA
ncbi:MAG: (E)-4-hydroxy-3-methylbut-2-enyl-diphosphate synthase [Bacteroidota bacterium]